MTDQLRMELGTLLDRLSEAARLLDDGNAAPTETLRAMYRDCIHEAMNRLRSESARSAALHAIVQQWRETAKVQAEGALNASPGSPQQSVFSAVGSAIATCAYQLANILPVSAQDRTIPHDQ